MTPDQQEKDISVCSRFREERKASGLDQQEIADALDVSAKTVGRWEKSVPIPSDKLAALAAHGVDVLYVVTGQRSTASAAAISEAEAQLLEAFRAMPAESQAAMLQLTSTLSSSGTHKLTDKL